MSADSNPSDQHGEFRNLLDLRMPGHSAAVSGVSDAVSGTLAEWGVPEEKRMEIELAVQEALVNAAVHGCKNDPTKEVRCRLQRDHQGRVVITVTDPGSGFSPESIADPKRAESLYADHGRGVYLIRQLMDEVQFEQGGNQIRMWKY